MAKDGDKVEVLAGVQIINLGEVMATLHAIPQALVEALAFRNYDYLSHARSSLIAEAGRAWPGRRGAQKLVASRTFRYGRTSATPTRLDQVKGEAFVAANTGETFGDERFKIFEEGGSVASRKPSAVPVEALRLTGAARKRAEEKFRAMLAGGELQLVGGRYLIYREPFTRVKRIDGSFMPSVRIGQRTRLLGVLTRSRKEPARLKFFATHAEKWAKHSPKYDRAIEQSLDAAGQAALLVKTRDESAKFGRANAAFTQAYRSEITKGMSAEIARKAGELARKAVMAQRLAPEGRTT